MLLIIGVLLFFVLLIVARLLELQIVRGKEYREAAQSQHFGNVELPAKRGDVLGVSSKTNERTILATSVTLDLVYVDPLVVDDPRLVANTLAEALVTPEFHALCSSGSADCPRELVHLYAPAFDPIELEKFRQTGALLEPLPFGGKPPPAALKLPNVVQARDTFAQEIEDRISQKQVTFVPLKYGATKVEMKAVEALHIPGVAIVPEQELIYADPETINQSLLGEFSEKLAAALHADPTDIRRSLRSRSLRYIPVMRKLPIALSRKILELKTASAKATLEAQKSDKKSAQQAELKYPLRSVALIAEHWRNYPDSTLGSHVIGFLNPAGEPQYGVERTFDPQLRGQKGSIRAVSDPSGGQILRSEQTIADPRDGDTVILTIDRTIQKEVENILAAAVEKFKADSGQAVVMDPQTGRVLAMANAPLFNSNNYTAVNDKETLRIDAAGREKLAVEVFDPQTNARVVTAYMPQVFTASGRLTLTEKTRAALVDLEKLYDIRDLTRYYVFVSDTIKREIFPTKNPDIWLKFRNNLGIGAYLNRAVQEIYEPGSVLKAITMAIAIDQGEVTPTTMYDDVGLVRVDEFPIDNNDHKHYGRVTMTNCIEFSINTCMTDIAFKLGAKLFYGALARFGFGQITGIELEDELPGVLHPWRDWARSELATKSFGQGISATPLQVITAWAPLANGGKLLKPTILDSIIHEDGTVEKTEPKVIDQVITKKASETMTAILVSSANNGFAKAGKPDGYRVAAKTGTSQIAGPGGKYETGTGSTVATFAGYGPPENAKFLILVKIDRPKNAIHGATAAAPVFKDIAAFLFRYYDIPPQS